MSDSTKHPIVWSKDADGESVAHIGNITLRIIQGGLNDNMVPISQSSSWRQRLMVLAAIFIPTFILVKLLR